MRIEAGDLREVIAIQASDDVADDYGSVTRTWSTVSGKSAVRARIRQITARDMLFAEKVSAEQINSAIQHYVDVRYDGDITRNHRVLWGSRVLPILRVNAWDVKNRWMTLECAEDV